MVKKNWMDEALTVANAAGHTGEVPVGAVIVKDDILLASSGNRTFTDCDPCAHAEIIVIRRAAELLGTTYLDQCDLYVTLEPCAMCAGAISWARIRRLYFGAYDPKSGGVDHGAQVFSHTTCHHRPEIIGGIQEAECHQNLTHWFQQLRNQ